jgi:hypothetical protein
MTDKTGYDALMHDVCVGYGFCGCIKDGEPLHVDHFIPSEGMVSADQFVEWLFLADDMNPSSYTGARWDALKQKIRSAFVEHMGSDVVDAARLRWDTTLGPPNG